MVGLGQRSLTKRKLQPVHGDCWNVSCITIGAQESQQGIYTPTARKRPRAKQQGSKAYSIHVNMVIQTDSKATLLLEHEATPRDLTAVSATGWEVLPGSQMLLGKCIQCSSTSGTRDCHWNVGKHCNMVDKRLLGLYPTLLFN